jgi:hypothetical protein
MFNSDSNDYLTTGFSIAIFGAFRVCAFSFNHEAFAKDNTAMGAVHGGKPPGQNSW